MTFVSPFANTSGVPAVQPATLTRHFGVVQSVQTVSNTITVNVDGITLSGVLVRNGYAPQAGDIALLDVLGQGGIATSYVVADGVVASSTAAGAQWSPGDLKLAAYSTVSAGWLACDGTAYLTTAYPALYAAIGTAWGSGSGTFKVPDLRGRVPVAAGTGSGLTARVLAATGGEETHALTSAEGPSHSHSHSHSINDAAVLKLGSGSVGLANSPAAQVTNALTGVTDNGDATASGSGTGHNTMQPFAVVTYFIKT